MASVLSRSAIIAPKTFNRWLIPPAALAIHLCIGQVYAFSVFKIPFMSHFEAGEVEVGWIFSIAILMLGISSAVFGTWVEKAGPRASMVAAGTCWVVGFLIAALGIVTGQLWLVYLGYGVIGGIGLGIGYISPVSTLMKWFPDRPGLATGLAIMGFGGGALIASPMSNALMALYGGGDAPENLVAGLTPTFLTLGIVYALVIAAGAFVIRVPHPEWTPKGFDPAQATAKPLQTTGNVSARNAVRTRQFWLLWVVLFLNVTAGIGILENAAPMIQSYFGITAAAAAGYVGLLSLGNMAGRFVWSTTSDYLGRKNNYMIYLGGGLILYLLVAFLGGDSLFVFITATLLIISFYGGGFSTVPAYLKDLFGTYQVGAIHGRLLTAWSAAGVAGPLIVNSVVEAGEKAGKEGPALYTPGLFIMAGALLIGFIANTFVKAVDDRYLEPEDTDADAAGTRAGADARAGAGSPLESSHSTAQGSAATTDRKDTES
ncbi:nitrate/nitrite transporter NarK [Brevibacterium sanguinis]|uniref:Nitrate/nitrite transporter NarK n=2 Tax=Brevibacterium TaxID=1696 RepID=A0A366IHK1_9MICO|nr:MULTISPECIES: OFA family MFS transporter [Brevibacterium]RBP65033.1 nitrate/nitrite transporter NarK [Brevibacterium sanguinis]RBP71296.1 nitrate/nitrite transporter NarK [Brevibacterium celere]